MHFAAHHSRWQTCIPEILTEIFIFKGPLEWPGNVASPILQVCSSWRRAALATPLLWTSVDFCIDDLCDSSADSLECWLLRRGRSPIYLDVALRSATAERKLKRDDDQKRHNQRLRRFESLICARAHSWRRLDLSELPRTMVDILHPTLLSKATRLEHLLIANYVRKQTRSAARTSTSLVHLSHLKTVKMKGISINLMPQFRASQATVLDLAHCECTKTDFMELMKNMPAIRDLIFYDWEPHGVTDGSLEKNGYICPSLKSLTFRANFEISLDFLKALCRGAPLLEELHMNTSVLDLPLNQRASNVTFPFLRIVIPDPNNEPIYSNWGYIVDQSKSLQTLQTVFYDISEFPATFPPGLLHLKLELLTDSQNDFDSFELEFITAVLESIPQLETLNLRWSCDTEEISFTPFIQALTLKSRSGFFICPRLHSLDLHSLLIDEHILILATQIHTRLVEDLQSSIKDSGLKNDSMKFTVTLEGCFLLPEIKMHRSRN